MFFPAESNFFWGWGVGGGRESLLGLGITWSLLPGKIRTQTEADRPLESASNGNFSTRALGCGVAQTPGAAHPSTRTRGGFGRTPAVGGVDSAPSELVNSLAHTPTRWPKPWHSGQSRLCNATLGPKKPTLRRDDPSRLAGGSPKHSRQHPHTDPDFSRVTLSTLSRPRFGLSHFYLRVHPEKEEKKIQRRSESIGKKNFQKGVHSGGKAQTLPTFKRQQGFQKGAGKPLPTRT
ncbi:uncharacterized protein LOC111165483 [Delphinapterus leucas]|uniref:Uncharacterized protein LOC111165483 n=1 Tax=Delphinapterus leucas TaxID=9749 RepID=A0A2Y9LQC7_DELLE|nr:uncharacterized protein LOC111165483 [Delphinapterus leucas]